MSQKRVPGPKERPLVGSLPNFAKDPLAYMVKTASEYGDLVKFTMFGQPFYMVTNPDAVREVLITKAAKLPKAKRDVDILSRFIGKGLVTSNGEYHKQQRKLVQPAFHTNRIQAYAETMVNYAAQTAVSWPKNGSIDMSEEMMTLTLFIVAKTLVNADRDHMADVAERVGQAVHVLQAISDEDFNLPFLIPDWIPTSRNRRRLKAREVLNHTINEMVTARRGTAVNGQIQDTGDLLSMLLLSHDEAGGFMNDEQVRDELITLFVAGHETTSNALTWTWYLLSQHPEVEQKLHNELDVVLNDRLPTLADLPNLPYTLQVIKESMRLYPPAWLLNGRQAIEAITIGGYPIPKDGVVFISPYVMHRQPKYFPEPERFDPERFTLENEKLLPKYVYMPFGGGGRICIGNSFAMMEAHLIVATLAQRLRFELIPNQTIATNPQVTLSAKYGIKMRVKPRSPNLNEKQVMMGETAVI